MACGSISLFAVSSKKKILWKLWLWFSKKFHLRVFSDWISKFPFWRQILDIYRQPLLNVLNEVKNNKLGNCCSFCILLSTCWPDFICERQSLENNPGVLPDTPIMHRFCHPKLCTTYCFWFHQGITVVLREINKRQCLCEILGDKTEVYYGRCANTERSPVVARWNPSEGGDRGGLEILRRSSARETRWRISRSTYVVGLAEFTIKNFDQQGKCIWEYFKLCCSLKIRNLLIIRA